MDLFHRFSSFKQVVGMSLASLLIAGLATGQAFALSEYEDTEKWKEDGPFVFSANLNEQKCYLTARHKNGFTLIYGLKKGRGGRTVGSLSFFSREFKHKVGQSWDFELTFDKRKKWKSRLYGEALSTGLKGLTARNLDEEFLSDFSRYNLLTLTSGRNFLGNFKLKGTKAAVEEVLECATALHQTNVGLKENKPAMNVRPTFGANEPFSYTTGLETEDSYNNDPSTDNSDDVAIVGLDIRFDESNEINNVAVIISNSDYDNIGDLRGPVKDVKLISNSLKSKGFKIFMYPNIKNDFVEKMTRDLKTIKNKGTVLLYYAGHGGMIDGNNSLILSKFNPTDPDDKDYIIIEEILLEIRKMNFSSYLFAFDACRNILEGYEPTELERKLTATERSGLAARTRSISMAGLNMAPLSSLNYAISFSASDGQVALDSTDGTYSPYAKAFAKSFRNNISVTQALLDIRREVIEETGGQQDPELLLKWRGDVEMTNHQHSRARFMFGGLDLRDANIKIKGKSPNLRYVKLRRSLLNEFDLVKVDPYQKDTDLGYGQIAVGDMENPRNLPAYMMVLTQKNAPELFKKITEDHSFDYRLAFEIQDAQGWFAKWIEENSKSHSDWVKNKYPQGWKEGGDWHDGFIPDLVSGFDVYFDLDSNGELEELSINFSKWGGSLGFSNNDGAVGFSDFSTDWSFHEITSIYAWDFTKNGYQDILLKMGNGSGRYILLDGKRIVESIRGRVKLDASSLYVINRDGMVGKIEKRLKRYFSNGYVAWCKGERDCEKAEWILGEIAQITLFFDIGWRYIFFDEKSITAQGEDTWGKTYQENLMSEKSISFDENKGVINFHSHEGSKYFDPIWKWYSPDGIYR